MQKNYSNAVILVCGFILVGIWHLANTIALRNILLLIIPLLYLYSNHNLKIYTSKAGNFLYSLNSISVLLILLLLWVIFHYFFIGQLQSLQLSELKSTWFRCFLGLISGLAFGAIWKKFPGYTIALIISLTIGFLILIIYFINLTHNQQDLFRHHPIVGNIFLGKINAVYAGNIIIGLSFGTVFDIFFNRKKRYFGVVIFGIIIAILLVIYTYIFILKTRAGIGSALLISLIAFFYLILVAKKNYIKILASVIFLISISLCAIYIQKGESLAFNYLLRDSIAGWNLNGDIKIHESGDIYPIYVDQTGVPVDQSTFERAAWLRSGINAIKKNIYGYGVLENPMIPAAEMMGRSFFIKSSHNGIIDLSISFGVPALSIVVLAFWLIYRRAQRDRFTNPLGFTALFLVFGLFVTYGLFEATSKHSVELLVFWLAVLSELQRVP